VWDNCVRHVDVKGGVGEIAGKHHEYAEGAQAGTQRGTILHIQGHVQTTNTGKCSEKKYREMSRQKYREMFRQKIQGNVQTKIQGNVQKKIRYREMARQKIQENVQTNNTGKCTDKKYWEIFRQKYREMFRQKI